MKRTRQRIAMRVATKYLSDISEMLDPDTTFKNEDSLKPEDIIMQRNKVLHHHFEDEGDPELFEKVPEFDDVNYLVRYVIDEKGRKRKKDSF